MFGFRLGVARHHQFPSISQRDMPLEHQNAGKGFQHGSGRQSRRVRLQPLAQRYAQTIGQKAPGLAGFLVRGAQLVQKRVAFPGPLTSATQHP
jgi:hypothetical protein